MSDFVPNFEGYCEGYTLVHCQYDEVLYWQTIHHPYFRDGKPWGMEHDIAYNKTRDKWVLITPASGSHYEIVSEEKAKSMLEGARRIK